jgi:hypothetical protein
VPVELAAVVAKMMAKDPRRRYQTPDEVVQAMKPFFKPKTAAPGEPRTEAYPPAGTTVASEVAPAALHTTGTKEVAAKEPRPEVSWERLIAIPEPEGLIEVKPKSSLSGLGQPWPRWVVPAVAVGILLAVIMGYAAGVFWFRTSPPPDVLPSPKPADRFVALFNGKDLQGWKTHPSQPGNWRVENGLLIGSGPPPNGRASHLYTDRNDFRDFHLRVVVRMNDEGNSAVYFRSTYGPTWPGHSPWFPEAYEARIKIQRGNSDETGSLFETAEGFLGRVHQPAVSLSEFFTLEVIARGNHIVIKVNGQTTADYTDTQRRHSRGHIALQQYGSTSVEFRTIEIKELPGSSGPPKSPTTGADRPGVRTQGNRLG